MRYSKFVFHTKPLKSSVGSTFTRNINLEQPHFQCSTAHVATGYHIRLSRLKEMFFKLWVTIYNVL